MTFPKWVIERLTQLTRVHDRSWYDTDCTLRDAYEQLPILTPADEGAWVPVRWQYLEVLLNVNVPIRRPPFASRWYGWYEEAAASRSFCFCVAGWRRNLPSSLRGFGDVWSPSTTTPVFLFFVPLWVDACLQHINPALRRERFIKLVKACKRSRTRRKAVETLVMLGACWEKGVDV